MKKFILSFLLLTVSLFGENQNPQFYEPNTSQAQAGTLGFPYIMTPRRVAAYVTAHGGSGLTAIAPYSTLSNNTGASAIPVAAQSLILGTPGYSDTGIAAQFTGSISGYYQHIIQNTSAGTSASANFIVSNNLGTATTNYGEYGINSSTFTGTGSFNLPGAVYLDSASGDLVLGTLSSKGIHFVINGATTDALLINTSGNLISTGTLTLGSGSSVAGAWAAAQGTATTAPTSSVGFMAPTSVTTKFMMTLPGAPVTGFLFNTGTSDPSTLSFVAANGTGNVLLSSGTAAIASGKTLTVSNSVTLSGTDGSTISFGTGGTPAYIGTANSWAAGVKQTFSPNGTTAGFNVGSVSGDPGTPANGDLWYDSTGNLLRARINGATVSLNASGGSWSATSTNVQTQTALGATTASGYTLTNTTAAAAGVQQVSPASLWVGQGWKTTATAASQTVGFQVYVLPVQGTTNPTGEWHLQQSINGGAYADVMTITSGGTLTTTGVITAGSSFSTNSITGGFAAGNNDGFKWNSKSYLKSPSDGSITLFKADGTTPGGIGAPVSGLINRFRSNSSVSAQTPAATTRTYVTGSDIGAITAGDIVVGTMIFWEIDITKTAAGTASAIFDIAFGTAGSTADTAQVSFTKPAGAAQIDHCLVKIGATVKTNSASGVVIGDFTMMADGTNVAGGFLGAAKFVSSLTTTSGTFNTTTPTHVGICVTAGASDAWTINSCKVWSLNL